MIERSYLLALVTAAMLAGCGATPPQAPLPDAKKLDSATSGISTACGLSAQVTAFPGGGRADLLTLEATASGDARKLATVFARDPDWIYQGETVRQIVRASLTALDACGLHGAAATLRAQTARG